MRAHEEWRVREVIEFLFRSYVRDAFTFLGTLAAFLEQNLETTGGWGEPAPTRLSALCRSSSPGVLVVTASECPRAHKHVTVSPCCSVVQKVVWEFM